MPPKRWRNSTFGWVEEGGVTDAQDRATIMFPRVVGVPDSQDESTIIFSFVGRVADAQEEATIIFSLVAGVPDSQDEGTIIFSFVGREWQIRKMRPLSSSHCGNARDPR